MSGLGRVVAELGRPETPEETAARKDRDRALRRSRQNFRNLVASVGVSVAVVIGIALVLLPGTNPANAPARATIDVAAVAHGLTATAGQPLVAPAVPSGWRANAAQLRGRGSDAAWYVGWVAGSSGYAGLTEGLPGTAATIDEALAQADPTGTTVIDGVPWRVYDRRDLGSAAGNVAYGLATRLGDVRLAVYGTVPAGDVRTLAQRAVADARAQGLTGAAALP